jgi:hypothetical protein
LAGHGEAMPLFERAYALRREALGERAPAALSSLNNLAVVYEAVARRGEALADSGRS